MTRINPIENNYLEYVLTHNNKEYVIQEPVNWKSAERGFYRSQQYHGILLRVSDSIEFSGASACWLREVYLKEGVLAEVEITEYIIDPITSDIVESYSGILDFATVTQPENRFRCKINSDLTTQKMQSRWRTEIDINSEVDMDGKAIDPNIDWVNVKLHDRVLYSDNWLTIGSPYKPNLLNGYTIGKKVVLLTNISDNGNRLKTVKEVSSEYVANSQIGGAESFFFVNNENTGLIVEVEIEFEMYVPYVENEQDPLNYFDLRLQKYAIDESNAPNIEYVPMDMLPVIEATDFQLTNGKVIYVKKTFTNFIVGLREAVSLEFGIRFTTNVLPKDGSQTPEFRTVDVKLAATTTYSEETDCRALLPVEIFRKILQNMGSLSIKSDFLSNLHLAVTNGFNIRNVPELMDNMNVTFQKTYDSYDKIFPLGLEVFGNEVRIENREYFYQKFLAYDFGNNVSEVEFEHNKELGYSEINIGFDTANFSENITNDEFNVRSIWTSPINTYRNVLEMVSNIQAGAISIENLRRIQWVKGEDRTYERRGDNSIYFLDLKDTKEADDSYRLRRWQDDFEEEPENLTYPTTAYNLRLSPMNRLRRLGSWINFGFTKFMNRQLTFSSSTGISEMECVPKGETVSLAENGSIPLKTMGYPTFTNERVTFRVEPNTIDNLINKRENGVPMVYGLFRFEYKSEEYYGYLFSFDPNTNQVELILEN